MIYVTHDQIEALTLADRIAVMRGGYHPAARRPEDDLQQAREPLRRRLHRLAGDDHARRADRRRPATDPPSRSTASTVPLAGYDGAVPGRGHRRDPRRPAGARDGAAEPTATACRRSIDIDEPMGSDSLLWLTFAGQPLSARTGADHALQPRPAGAASPSTSPAPRSSTARPNSASERTQPTRGDMLDLSGHLDPRRRAEARYSLSAMPCRATCIRRCSPPGSSPTPTSAATSTPCAGSPTATGRSRASFDATPATAPGSSSPTASTPSPRSGSTATSSLDARQLPSARYRPDVPTPLVPGENRIEIAAPLRHPPRPNALQAAQPFPVPYHAGNCPIPNGNMLRKPQCDFGWDWNIALAPVGVYGRIGLVGPEGAIADVTDRASATAPTGVGRPSRSTLRRLRATARSRWQVAALRRRGARRGRRRRRRLRPHRARRSRPGALVAGGRRRRSRSTTLEIARRRRRSASCRSRSATSASSPSPTPPAAASRSTSTAAPIFCPRRQLDPRRRPARPHHRGEDPRPPRSPPPTPT